MPPRRIAVLGGTGNEGSGLATRWAKAGHEVIIGSRNPMKAAETATEINTKLGVRTTSGATNVAAAAAGEIIVLTVPSNAQRSTATECIDFLRGKILVDATVPLVPPRVARVQMPNGSAVAALQAQLGEEVKVVSAFQNVSAHLLRDLDHQIDCDVLVCGDDPDARETVIGLIHDAGLRGIHAGPIANSLAVEALTCVLLSVNGRYKVPGSGIRITGVG